MKVFVAGATGALGKQLVPLLVDNGHEVVGMTRTEAKAGLVWDMGEVRGDRGQRPPGGRVSRP